MEDNPTFNEPSTPSPAWLLTWKDRIPGLTLTTGLGMLSVFMSRTGMIPYLDSITIAIIAGIIVGNTTPIERLQPEGIVWSKRVLLSWAVALLGLNLNLNSLTQFNGGGKVALGSVVTVVLVTLGLGLLLGRMAGLPRSLGLLLGVGSAICGSSAIAAVAPLVTKDRTEIGLSVGVVNLLGTIGIFILPQLAALQGLGESASALLIGGSLQAVGHVVAAGFLISDSVGELATAVKMFRILLLGPVVIGLGMVMHWRGSVSSKLVPGYIMAFIALAVVGNLGILPAELTGNIKTLSKVMLTIAMAGVGLRIHVTGLFRQGPRVLIVGTTLFFVQILLLSLMIRFLN
jgi:uncharacterized integral membrane protein (TIGR00698 family)